MTPGVGDRYPLTIPPLATAEPTQEQGFWGEVDTHVYFFSHLILLLSYDCNSWQISLVKQEAMSTYLTESEQN